MTQHLLKLRNGNWADDSNVAFAKLIENWRTHPHVARPVVHFHGGLVSYAVASTTASRLTPIYDAGGGFPFFFAWESDLLGTVRNNFGEYIKDPAFKRFIVRLAQFLAGKLGQGGSSVPLGVTPPASLSLPSLGDVESSLASARPLEQYEPAREGANARLFRQDEEQPTPHGFSPLSRHEQTVLTALISEDALLREHAPSSGVLASPEAQPLVVGVTLAWWIPLATRAVTVAAAVVRRFMARRDHGLHATLMEEVIRNLGLADVAAVLWNGMKKDASDAAQPERPYHSLLRAFAEGGTGVRPLLVGHSAGCEHVIEVVKLASQVAPELRFDLVLLAPSCTPARLAEILAAQSASLGDVRLFGLSDALEQGDQLLPDAWLPDVAGTLGLSLGWVYPHSLLYFVSGVCETEADAPLVGLQRHHDLQHPAANPFVQGYFAATTGRTTWSPADLGPGRSTNALHHGSFDDDPVTLSSLTTLTSGTTLVPDSSAGLADRLVREWHVSSSIDVSAKEVETVMMGLVSALTQRPTTTLADERRVRALKRYVALERDFHLLAGKSGPGLRDLVASVSNTGALVYGDQNSALLELDDVDAAAVRARFKGLDIQEDVPHTLLRSPLLPSPDVILVPASLHGLKSVTLSVHEARKKSTGIPDAEVIAYPAGAGDAAYRGRTDASGQVTFRVQSSHLPFREVFVSPRSGYYARVWRSRLVRNKSLSFPLTPIKLPENRYDWGYMFMHASLPTTHQGEGVKVAVIDTGVNHACIPLEVAQGRSFINGAVIQGAEDVNGHGTHVAGIIAAQALLATGIIGHAPKVKLYAARVFDAPSPDELTGGYGYDIASAIQWAVSERCDIINLSMGSLQLVPIVRQALQNALANGVLIVAATGNEGKEVMYPARLREAVAVGAIGKRGMYPANSLHRDAEKNAVGADDVYVANFSCFGPEVRYVAPGVAVISTISGPYDPGQATVGQAFAALDGTSMAAPQVSGLAAAVLSAQPSILNASRDAVRVGTLLNALDKMCLDFHFPIHRQGVGMPRLP